MPGDRVRRIVVGRTEDIPPGARKIVTPFRGRAGVGVFNVHGTYHAVRNLCPHKRGPLCTGRVSGRIVADAPPSSDAPNLSVDRDDAILRCPWHLWEFEIATGQCLVDPRMRVKTYPVAIEQGLVVVYADPADMPAMPNNPFGGA
jgi:nitrite reductase/ring-hydroxylating ferredoxin subunit